jgi:hypothetical protein
MRILFFLLFLLSSFSAYADSPVIWGPGGYAKNLAANGFLLSTGEYVAHLTSDPSGGGGFVASIGSLGLLNNAGSGQLWVKTGAGNTAWTNALTASTGWSLLGNAGTNPAANYIGTSDGQDFVIRTNATERLRITSAGAYDTTLGTGIIHSDVSGILTSSAVDLSGADVTGTLGIANGGTGQVTANAALNALLPSQGGNAGKVLSTNGTDTSWAAALTNTLTSAHIFVGNAGNVATDVAVSGDIALTNAGVTSYAGIVPLNKGGTNANLTADNGAIPYSTGTQFSLLAHNASTGFPLLSGGAGAPTWSVLMKEDVVNSRLALGDTTVAPGANQDVLYTARSAAGRFVMRSSGGQDWIFEPTNGSMQINTSTNAHIGIGLDTANRFSTGDKSPLYMASLSSIGDNGTTVGTFQANGSFVSPILEIENSNNTVNNFEGLILENSASGWIGGLFGVNENHSVVGSATGHLELWTNNAGTRSRKMNIAKNGAVTMDLYTAGIAHFSGAGLISSSAVDLASSDVTGILPNANTTATSANTASTIVARDASGNFSAGTITAALSGNATTATSLAANPTDCSAGQFATAIDAQGNLTCATPASSGGGGGSGTQNIKFTLSGAIVPFTAIDGPHYQTTTTSVASVNISMLNSGDSGSTVVQMNQYRAGVLFSSATASLASAAAAPTGAVSALSGALSLTTGDIITVDVNSVATGNPAELSVEY